MSFTEFLRIGRFLLSCARFSSGSYPFLQARVLGLSHSNSLSHHIHPIHQIYRADAHRAHSSSFGTEFVYVKKSILVPEGAWHTRGLASGTFAVGFAPKASFFDSIQLTSSYLGRFPSSPEIFYNSKFAPIDPTTGKPNPKKTPPMLGTQPRHSIDTKLTYNFAPWTGSATFMESNTGSPSPTTLGLRGRSSA